MCEPRNFVPSASQSSASASALRRPHAARHHTLFPVLPSKTTRSLPCNRRRLSTLSQLERRSPRCRFSQTPFDSVTPHSIASARSAFWSCVSPLRANHPLRRNPGLEYLKLCVAGEQHGIIPWPRPPSTPEAGDLSDIQAVMESLQLSQVLADLSNLGAAVGFEPHEHSP